MNLGTSHWILLQFRRLNLFARGIGWCWKRIVVFFSIWRSLQLKSFPASWKQPGSWCWYCFLRYSKLTGCVGCCWENFQVVEIQVLTCTAERRYFVQWLGPHLVDSDRIVWIKDWILDPKFHRVGLGVTWSAQYKSSLIDFIAEFDLVDRFRLDQPGWEMWTLTHSSPSIRIDSTWMVLEEQI